MPVPLGVCILAAGRGTRMPSDTNKLLQPLAGAPMLEYVLDAVRGVHPAPSTVAMVVGHRADQISKFLSKYGWAKVRTVIQPEQNGTGTALMVSQRLFSDEIADILVIHGDVPLVTSVTLSRLIQHHRSQGNVATVLTMDTKCPDGYGRILPARRGNVTIVEDADANETEKFITQVSTGVMIFKAAELFSVLDLLDRNNASNEYYLSQSFELLASHGRCGHLQVAETEEFPNVNTFEQLAKSDKIARNRLMSEYMELGVHVVDPDNTYIEKGVEIGVGTRIFPFTVIHRGVKIGRECEIGPFAHLREGTNVEDRCIVGNFVECKNTSLGQGTQAKHLAYLGDVAAGAGVNIGAGTVACNYDGANKHATVIGDGAFIGSGTMIVAPRKIGDKAFTAAGSVITHDIEDGQRVAGIPAKPMDQAEASSN